MFKKFVPPKSHTIIDGMRLTDKMLSIDRKTYEKLGHPQRVDILYDEELKKIMLVPNINGRKITDSGWGSLWMTVKLTKIMPKGDYRFDGGHTFTLMYESN